LNDRIIVSGLEFHSHCGVTPAEREAGHRLSATVEIVSHLDRAASEDRLGSTVDYTRLCDLLLKLGRKSRYHLLETLAVKMAQEVLATFPILEVRVRLEKPLPPMEAIRGSFAVEVVRRRQLPKRKKKS
jgi:dihydroneopterin aldolase